MDTSLFKKWWLMTLKGIFVTALGGMLIVHPYTTTEAIVVFLGITLFIVGAFITYFAYTNRLFLDTWKWFLIEGIFDVVMGMILLFYPFESLYVIALLGGFWVLMLGFFQFAFGWNFKEKIQGWKYNIGHGILAVLIGIGILMFPMSGVIGFAIVFGITFFLYGVFLIMTSQRMRKHTVLLNHK